MQKQYAGMYIYAKTAYHVDDAIQSEDIITGSRQTCFFSMKKMRGTDIFIIFAGY